jgi:dipeptidyl aminopeptidase/acylaminoacyl peptidase
MSIDTAANMALGDAMPVSSTATETSVVVYSSRPNAKGGNSASSTSAYDVSQFFGDLVLLDVASGAKKVIASGIKCWGYRASPDGRSIAFTNQTEFTANTHHTLFSLSLYSLGNGRTSILFHDFELPDGRSFSWSPDSTRLSYCGAFPKLDCYVVSRDGGEPIDITPLAHPPFSGADRPPLWAQDGQHVYRVTSDGLWKLNVSDRSATRIATVPEYDVIDFVIPSRARQLITAENRFVVVIALNRATKQMAFYRIDLVTFEVKKLQEGDQFIGGPVPRYSFDVAADSKTIVYRAQDSAHPAEIWISDNNFTNPHQLTNINSTMQQYTLGKSKLVEWRGPNGETQQGVVLLPPGYIEQQRYPVIVYQYPGDRMSDRLNEYGLSGSGGVDDMQLFASRGFVVFLPDTPPPRKLSPMHGILEGLQPALDKLADLGIADMNRMGIIGASYGGYAVLSVITQTTKFKAAVARSSQGDMVGAYGYMRKNGDTFGVSWAETGQGGMQGTPWEHRDRYIENSPFYYLDRVETPLLLIHGSEDPAVSSSLADQTFVGLRRLGKEVEYARYEGEGHAEAGWGYANQLDYINRVIAWFDDHLKKPEAEKPK